MTAQDYARWAHEQRELNKQAKIDAKRLHANLIPHNLPTDQITQHLRAFWEKHEADRLARSEARRQNARVLAAERQRWLRIRRQYGIEKEEYYDLIDRQDNRCLICGTQFGTIKPCIDHCHRTGRIRGILCSPCNTILGAAHDDPDRLLAAIRYLQQATE